MSMGEIALILMVAVVVACVAAFLLLLAYKLGGVEKLQVEGSDIVSQMANCDFCMSWWLCVVLSLVMVAVFCDAWLLAVPFVATPIARRLI